MSLRLSTRALSPAALWRRLLGTGRRARPVRKPCRPGLEALEDRLAPATLTVLNPNDSGTGSLRAELALAQPGDTITFDAAAFANHQTIALTSGGLALNQNVSVSGPAGGVTVSGSGRFTVFSIDSAVNVTLSGLTIANGNGGFGGGISNVYGTLTLNNDTFTGNVSGDGGALYAGQGNTTLNNDTFTGNTGDFQGGAIEVVEGQLHVNGCTFTQNVAGDPIDGPGYGGAIFNSGAGTNLHPSAQVWVADSTFSGNSAGWGGALFIRGALAVADSTFAGNSASTQGGAVWYYYGQQFGVSGSTLSGNSAGTPAGAGGIYVQGSASYPSQLLLSSSIVAGNGNGDVGLAAYASVNAASSNNLIGTGSGGLQNGVNGNQVGVSNLGLAPLGWYGGPTQTMALLPGSPALGRGSATTPDQRGFARPASAPDVGAFQTQPGNLVVESSMDDSLGVVGPGQLSLRDAIDLANLAPTTGGATVTFDATAFANHQTIALTSGGLALNQNVSVSGPAGGVTVSGGGRFTVFSIDSAVNVTLSGLTIANGNGGFGGGISNLYGTLTLNNDTFTGNVSGDGGALYAGQGNTTLNGDTFTGNTGYLQGGAVEVVEGQLHVNGCTFTQNVAGDPTDGPGYGGAIFNSGAGTGPHPSAQVWVADSTFSGNSAGWGGALFIRGALAVADSTFAGNSASTQGGAVWYYYGQQFGVSGSTLSGNSAGTPAGAGGIYVQGSASYPSQLLLSSSIVAGNSNGDVGLAAYASVNAASSNNLIGTGGGGLQNGVNGNQVGVSDPGLAPLGWYGGPTQTMALLPGSPALGRGSATTPDQRGFARPASAPDVGAFQTQVGGVVVNTTADAPLGPLAPGQLSLRDAVNLANSNTSGKLEAITFDPTTFSTPQVITLKAGALALTGTSPIAITGPANGVTIDGGNQSQVFTVAAGTTATLSNLTIAHGYSATNGGGIANSGTLTLTADNVSNDTANSNGGGVYNAGALTVSGSTFSNDYVNAAGGAIENVGALTLNSSTLSNNIATVGGGACNSGTLNVNDSTIASNLGFQDGGGLYNLGTLTMNGDTVAGNSGPFLGGGLYLGPTAHTYLSNTLVAGNSAVAGADVSGTVGSSDHDLIGTTDRTVLRASSGDLLNVEPSLAPLGNHGGPTQTMPLLPGSPGIDAGDDHPVLPGPSGLVDWYRGEGNASDSVGNSNGTLNGGVSFAPGVAGQAFTFNGQGSYVDLGTGADVVGTGAFTVAAWIKTTSDGTILQQRDPGSCDGEYQLAVSGGKVYWWDYGNSQNVYQYGFQLTSTGTVNDGHWHLVVGVRQADGSGLIYVDGVQAGYSNGADVSMGANIHVYVGEDVRNAAFAAYGYTPNNLVGQIDEVQIYNRTLGASEVQALAGTSGNPLGTDQRGYARKAGAHVDVGATEYQNDLAVSLGASPNLAQGIVTYTLTVTNNGPDAATGFSVSDLLPAGVSFQSLTAPTGWTSSTSVGPQGTTATATMGPGAAPLAAGASVTLTLVVNLTTAGPGSTLGDSVWLGLDPWDMTTANNQALLLTTL